MIMFNARRGFSVALALLLLQASTQSVAQSCGAVDPAGEPIGGGAGYSRVVSAAAAEFVVTTPSAFLSSLQMAAPGDTVFIPGNVTLDLRERVHISIPDGVTIASDRGLAGSPGALIVAPELEPFASDIAFFVVGNSVRVTGLRLRGPDPVIGIESYAAPATRGISAESVDDLEVDNCELWGWGHAAIRLESAHGVLIHHDVIHHNLRTGLGYGVSHNLACDSVIESNIFFANRHDIAGSGHIGQSYVARYNLVKPCGTEHHFDMHGGCSREDYTNIAGQQVVIEHNTFQSSCREAVKIRGVPLERSPIRWNLSPHDVLGPASAFCYPVQPYGPAVQQCNTQPHPDCNNPVSYMNLEVTGNCLLPSSNVPCTPTHPFEIVGFCATGTWTSAGVEGRWHVGDFNGDGRTDVFRTVPGTASGADVYLSTGSAFTHSGTWTTASPGDDGWYVADVNGDGKDDIFRYVSSTNVGAGVFLSTGSSFQYDGSWTGAGHWGNGWFVGDFNGDGRADIARYNGAQNIGTEVYLSNGTRFVYSGVWTTAGFGSQRWYIGDFNEDGRDDLLRYVPGASGAEVLLSTGSAFASATRWSHVENDIAETCSAHNPSGNWFPGDFNGDGATDIVRYLPGESGAEVLLSNAVNRFEFGGSWTRAGFGSHGWYVGDFNGDNRDDLLRYVSGSGSQVYVACASEPTLPCVDRDNDLVCTQVDCDDLDGTTYPGAPERNDGQDNQCPGDQGYGVVDETSGDSGFHNPNDKSEYSWTMQVGATSYQVARSTLRDLSGNCLKVTTVEPLWRDTAVPIPGGCFRYLNRPLTPRSGSWGQNSAGGERTNICP